MDRNLADDAHFVPVWSLSARRAWIEICRLSCGNGCCSVALRKESVDRNTASITSAVAVNPSLSARRAWIEIYNVLLDRYDSVVALRKESVDRNKSSHLDWAKAGGVALRKESVDRNSSVLILQKKAAGSLSARRAWIEIISYASPAGFWLLSLSARRAWIEMPVLESRTYGRCGRSPQGERG